jgi:hypothetical protein
VDELIVEDSWKRQVGGDWSTVGLSLGGWFNLSRSFLYVR